MTYLGYKYLPRTPELISQRRTHLDRYANLAQISQLTVHLLIILIHNFLASVPTPSKLARKGSLTVLLARLARSSNFRLGREVSRGCGTYGQWIFGLVWTAWLGFLCFAETANDYLHLTKRFGLIAASQLPIHYLLSMPQHPNSPLELLLRSNPHKQNLSLHKVTGKIIIAFIGIHISLYSIFFVQMGLFWRSIRQANIVVAIISAGVLFILGFTSMRFFRRRWYWWFYRIHVVGSGVILLLMFFHVKFVRIYLFECAVVVGLNAIFRTFGTRKL